MRKAGAKRKKREEITSSEVRNERILMENFVALQKVMVNLSLKMENLTSQISKLLELFEISAKALAEKDFEFNRDRKDNKEIKEKINSLLDQNKIIARGLTLLHEKEIVPEPATEMKPPIQPQMRGQSIDINEYQKSISSRPKFNELPKR